MSHTLLLYSDHRLNNRFPPCRMAPKRALKKVLRFCLQTHFAPPYSPWFLSLVSMGHFSSRRVIAKLGILSKGSRTLFLRPKGIGLYAITDTLFNQNKLHLCVFWKTLRSIVLPHFTFQCFVIKRTFFKKLIDSNSQFF